MAALMRSGASRERSVIKLMQNSELRRDGGPPMDRA